MLILNLLKTLLKYSTPGAFASMSPLRLQAHSGASAVQEFDAGFLQNRHNPAERVRSCADRAVEILHASNRSQADIGLLRKVTLRPSQQTARRAQMPSRYPDQLGTLSRPTG